MLLLIGSARFVHIYSRGTTRTSALHQPRGPSARSRSLLLFVFDLVNEAAQGARAKLVYVVAEVVLVDAFTQSDCLVESVDFHRSTPGAGRRSISATSLDRECR